MPIKYLLAQRITDGPHETPEFVDTGYPFLSVDGIQDGELHFEGCRFVSEDQHREFRRKAAPRRGDVLFGKAASTGKIARVKTDIEFSIWSPLALLRPSETKVTSAFLDYALKSQIAQGQIDVLVTTNTQNNISMEAIPRIRIPLPVLQQQRAIAEYLDRETARLDALVAAKERVLGLLAEKRRALITRAVTRGLDPRAPLRDSGIPWLGEIPAHWETWKLGHVAFVGNGSTPNRDNPEYWADGAIPWLNSSVVNQEEVTASDQFVTATALRECHLPSVKPGSVLVGITGQGKTRGSAVVLSFEATINQHLAFITPNAGVLNAWFLRWALFAAYEFLRSISDDAGGTKGALTCEAVAALRVPVPPIVDQHAIVEHIASETTKLKAMRAAIQRTIDLLNERRAALISAAVTGRMQGLS